MSKGMVVFALIVISFIYYLLGSPFGGGASNEPATETGICAGYTDESAFTNCMENQNTGADFPAP
jgi:hypothetical protein